MSTTKVGFKVGGGAIVCERQKAAVRTWGSPTILFVFPHIGCYRIAGVQCERRPSRSGTPYLAIWTRKGETAHEEVLLDAFGGLGPTPTMGREVPPPFVHVPLTIREIRSSIVAVVLRLILPLASICWLDGSTSVLWHDDSGTSSKPVLYSSLFSTRRASHAVHHFIRGCGTVVKIA